MNDLELINVTKRFKGVTAVNDVSLSVQHGEFLTLLGPSGCGKTTTLNMVAGFLHPDAGQILLGGKRIEHLPPYRRDTAMVFQQYALFPHMTVAENIAFGLEMHKVPRAEIAGRVQRAMAVVRLEGLGERRPGQLSGGQQQRVALARAIVLEPTVLLMDEPLSNLDLKLREHMRLEIKRIQRELNITAIYVTHDQGEALVMSDRIAVMNQGVIEQYGTPTEIYEHPRTPFVAGFIGTTNFLRGVVAGAQDGYVRVALGSGQEVLARGAGSASTGEVLVVVRPEHLTLGGNGLGVNALSGTVREVIYLGAYVRYNVELTSGDQVVLEQLNRGGADRVAAGEPVTVTARQEDCLVMPTTDAGHAAWAPTEGAGFPPV